MTTPGFLDTAKKLASESTLDNNLFPKISKSALYVVWYAYVLGNEKALLSTDVAAGLYFEVTRNAEQNVFYVDVYRKQSSRLFLNAGN